MKRLLVMFSIVIVASVYSMQPRPPFTDRAAYKKWLDDQSRAKKGKKNEPPKPSITQAQFDAGLQEFQKKIAERAAKSDAFSALLRDILDESAMRVHLQAMKAQGVVFTSDLIAELEKYAKKEPGTFQEFITTKN